MDSHIDTADPWAAAVESTEVSTSVVVETPLEAVVDEVEPSSDGAEASVEEPSKGGLFGRRKAKAEPDEDADKDEGFSLMSPVPVVMDDDPQFEIIDSEALAISPDLGLDDNVGDTLDESSAPLLAAPFDDELYPPLEAVEEGGLGSISSVLNPSSFARPEPIDFDSVSEEIANAVEEAQPAGIFGALSNPASMFGSETDESDDSDDYNGESVEDIIEKTEDSLDDIVAETDESLEDFVGSSHESLSEVIEDSQDSNEDVVAASETPETHFAEILLGETLVDDDAEDSTEAPVDGDEKSTHEATEDQRTAVVEDEPDEQGTPEITATEPLAVPADPFETVQDSEQSSVKEDPFSVQTEQGLVEAQEMEEAVIGDSADDSTQAVASDDEAIEEDLDMEPQQVESRNESSFSLTNAPAEPIEGDEGLFVSAGTEEEIQPVVLVTTDTVPGMEMGDSCGLVTAVQAAADATVLSLAIEKAHGDLSNRASEVGATAVISVTTSINEVQAGFLVVASGTAVLAAS